MSRSARASAPSVDPVLADLLGPEAATLPPALADRLLDVLAHAGNPASNSRHLAFFDALSGASVTRSSTGGSWRNAPVKLGHQCELAALDRALAGIAGVADVLAAAERARDEDEPEHQLNPYVTDQLFNALLALASHARGTLETTRIHLTGEAA